MKYYVSQIGAREHYAVPRSIQKYGKLEQFYTDFWLSPLWLKILKNMPQFNATKLLLTRHKYEINTKTKSIPKWKYFSLVQKKKYFPNVWDYYHFFDDEYTNLIQNKLKGKESQFDAFFTYNGSALQIFEYLKHTKVKILGQVDPGPIERRIIEKERIKFDEYFSSTYDTDAYLRLFKSKTRKELELADVVIVNSKWTKNCLVEVGVKSSKIKIVPLCYENSSSLNNDTVEYRPKNKFIVLWLGNILLRKGFHYFLEAANTLNSNSNIEFWVVGQSNIPTKILSNKSSRNIKYFGKVDRNSTNKFYRSADVFVLPTLSDGFAITQLEAMANGCPVIATNRCGEVVTHGKDGYIIEPYESDQIVEKITDLYNDSRKRYEMRKNALEKADQFTLKNYYDNLSTAVHTAIN